MLFSNENLSFELLDVLYIRQDAVSMFNTGRNFDALSFRIHADAHLKTETEDVHLTDGSVCFVPARQDYSRTARYDEMIVVHLNLIGFSDKRMTAITPKNVAETEARFRTLLSVWEGKRPGYFYTATAMLAELLGSLHRGTRQVPPPSPKIARAVAYMKENLSDPALTIRDCAAAAYISEVYFRRLFREAYGKAPQAYLIDLRIAHATSLLLSGYYSIKEVATLSGYRDYKYFSTEFKRMKGISPSEYLYNYKE